MSADNGIYILKNKKQYRVLATRNIENIFDYSGDYIPDKVIDYFGDCKYTTNAEKAFSIAQAKLRNMTVCEYGIRLLPEYNESWENVLEKANKQKRKDD